MFRVRSLRASGTLVEVVQNGKTIYKELVGMGATESEVLTDDIKNQKTFGYVSYEYVAAEKKLPPKSKPVAKVTPVVDEVVVAEDAKQESTPADPDVTVPAMELSEQLAAQDQFEAKKSGEANEPPSAQEYLSKEELGSMTKRELKKIVKTLELDIPDGLHKDELIDALMEHQIPKE